MKRKLKKYIILVAVPILFSCLFSCTSKDSKSKGDSVDMKQKISNSETSEYISVTAEDAKKLMDKSEDYIILDVRTENEYNDFHIKDAILIPDYDIKTKAEDVLTDKDQMIFVYCRSGRRSKLAAETLEEMGYTNIIEFGGIVDWPYEIE